MNNHLEALKRLKSLPKVEIDKIVNQLVTATPEKTWPDGFPASIDPKLLLIGISYGNSPDKNSENKRQNEEGDFASQPCAIKDKSSHFYYPDTRRYWEKLRYLSHSYFKNSCNSFSETDAISLTTHINLGTGSAGKASVADVEEEYVKWASKLVNCNHNPDLVILFGLSRIIRDRKVNQWWNHQTGIQIDWEKPDYTREFSANGKKYKHRLWTATNSNGHQIKIDIWPNHPSRHPFGSFDLWKQSVDEFIVWQDSIWQAEQGSHFLT
ncbi:hypothetical protein [Nitrosomonas sp.]|jgi:hypothetical protein|uniref:hypothetical protein n=1 Tax=Nitrosomonas sp. TaxID=42353 RepID=UPI00271F214F|nr:hypothetical protein [Nitrosomonas sp.]MDO8895442.1 hypothetical protein [Nitrosomonas sp.]